MASPEKVHLRRPLRVARVLRHDGSAVKDEGSANEQRAYQKGFAEGSEQMNQQLLEQRSEMNELRAGLFRSLEQSVAAAVAEVRQALPELAMEALRRLLARVEMNQDTVVAIVEELLAEIGPDVGPVEVRMHPDDLKLIENLEAGLVRNHPGLNLTCDDQLGRGDCQAKTRFGKIDARLRNKLEKLQESLIPGS